MEAEILDQLVWIKWLLAANVALIVLFVLILVAFCVRMQVKMRRNMPRLAQDWREMLAKGKAAEVVELTRERLKVAPHDAEAHWCLAQAYLRTGDHWRALSTARQLERVAPEWERYTNPLIAAMEWALAKSESTPRPRDDESEPEPE
jgi:cytochrome c-type biogenesis protein CcmH/NrfG